MQSCFHCLAVRNGQLIRRLLGTVMHASQPNEFIHFDFCYIGQSEQGFTYVLILKDDFSGYIRLVPTIAASAEETAQALLRWFADFRVVSVWVSDRGSHFKNELVQQLQRHTKSRHHYTLAYCPWSNGTVEVVRREILHVITAVQSELKLPPAAWPSVIDLVQSALNQSASDRLASVAPLTAFTGLPADDILKAVLRKLPTQAVKVHTLQDARAQQVLQLELAKKALEMMHVSVQARRSKKQQDAIQRHNARTGVRPVNFHVGDYVLQAKLLRHRRQTMDRWYGPKVVTKAMSDFVLEVEDLITKKRGECHISRLMLYRDRKLEDEDEVMEHLEYQQDAYHVVDDFVKI
jgi:hypothetical protein